MRITFPFQVIQKTPNSFELVEGNRPMCDFSVSEDFREHVTDADCERIYKLCVTEVVKAAIKITL
jgi:hypothetical protein